MLGKFLLPQSREEVLWYCFAVVVYNSNKNPDFSWVLDIGEDPALCSTNVFSIEGNDGHSAYRVSFNVWTKDLHTLLCTTHDGGACLR